MTEAMYIVDPNNYRGYASGCIPANSQYVEYTNPPKSFGEYQDRYGDNLILCTHDEYQNIYAIPYYQSLQKPWEEITEERFHEMLNIMPPLKWRNVSYYETFYVCEAYTSDLHSVFARSQTTNKCWEAMRPISTSVDALYKELNNLK